MDWLKRLLRRMTLWPAPTPTPIPPILTLDDLTAAIHRHGLGEMEAEIVALAAPVFHIIAGPPAPAVALGASRLGGAPDLPEGSAWPRARYGLARFLGQFDLADIRARTGSDDLPPSGLLSLFIVGMESSADPVQLHSILIPEGTPLTRLEIPTDAEAFGDLGGPLRPISFSFQHGLSVARADLDRLGRGEPALADELHDFGYDLVGRPPGAIGEWLGRGFDGANSDDERQVAHGRRIGRPDLARYAFIESWAKWEELKTIRQTLANGSVYRPWRDADDADVRWLLENREAFDAGVEALRLLVRIESNPTMDLWLNDADPIYVFIDAARLTRGDLSELCGTVTQG